MPNGPEGKGNGPTAVGRDGPPPPTFVSEVQPPPADYTNRLFMERFSDDFLFALIKKGRLGATEQMGFNTMNPYGHIMSDEEIWSVILYYIRKTFIEGKHSRTAAADADPRARRGRIEGRGPRRAVSSTAWALAGRPRPPRGRHRGLETHSTGGGRPRVGTDCCQRGVRFP